jgi:hypothetical protein
MATIGQSTNADNTDYNNNNDDDIEDEDDDDDDDESTVVQESLCDRVTKQSYASLMENSTSGRDLLKLTYLLPNSSQRYGHSLTINAIVKIMFHHPMFWDQSFIFCALKVRTCEDTSVSATFTSLNQANKQLLKDMIKEVNPNHGPWCELTQLLHDCDEAFNDSAATLCQVRMPANRIAYIAHMLFNECLLV